MDTTALPGQNGPPAPPKRLRAKQGGKLRLKTLATLDQRTLAARKSRQVRASLEADLVAEARRHLIEDEISLSAMIESDVTMYRSGETIKRNEFLATINARRRTVLALVALGIDHRGSGGPILDLDDIEREIANEEIAAAELDTE